jgi:DNA/RNA endonuclease G (NUC1)
MRPFLRLGIGGGAVLSLLALAACSDRSAVGPDAQTVALPASAGTASRALDCTVSVREGMMGCRGSGASVPGGASGNLVVGGQDVFVRLASTNVAYDADSETLSADVTLQNLLPQAMGTTDGTAVSPGGIRVFFASGPTATSGTGAVSVANADGLGDFTSTAQPYFEYDQKLDSGAVTTPRPWRFNVPATVGTFTFRVYVSAPLKPLLVINEIMADPAVVADSLGEWVEIYNRGLEAVNLGGWKLASGNDAVQTIPAGISVPARGYVVLGKKTDPAKNGGVNVAWSFGALNLANSTSDWVALRPPAGATADSVVWGTAPTSGRARGVLDPRVDNTTASGANWALATTAYGNGANEGTPGAANDGSGTAPAPAGPARTVVLSPDSAVLTVGGTRQFTAITRDSAGQAASAALAWTSTNPAVVTVSGSGLVAAQASGLASIIVTAGAGIADTALVRVDTAATSSGAAVYLNHLEFGRPTDADTTDEVLVRHAEYVLSYSPRRGGPSWVAWDLNATHFGAAARCNCFTADPLLPDTLYHVVTSDYTGSGYSRGHMVMSAERTATTADNAHAFYMTNILPQYQDLNAGPWELFENYSNDLAQAQGKEVYVIAGGVWPASPATLNNAGKVQIPTYTWKILVVVPRGKGLADVHSTADLQVVAVMMPNVTGIQGQPWEPYRTTVDAIEAATGYDFLAALPDSIENVVEAN